MAAQAVWCPSSPVVKTVLNESGFEKSGRQVAIWQPLLDGWRLEIIVVSSLSWQQLLDANHVLSRCFVLHVASFYVYHLVSPCDVAAHLAPSYISCNNVSPRNLLRVIAILSSFLRTDWSLLSAPDKPN